MKALLFIFSLILLTSNSNAAGIDCSTLVVLDTQDLTTLSMTDMDKQLKQIQKLSEGIKQGKQMKFVSQEEKLKCEIRSEILADVVCVECELADNVNSTAGSEWVKAASQQLKSSKLLQAAQEGMRK